MSDSSEVPDSDSNYTFISMIVIVIVIVIVVAMYFISKNGASGGGGVRGNVRQSFCTKSGLFSPYECIDTVLIDDTHQFVTIRSSNWWSKTNTNNSVHVVYDNANDPNSAHYA